MHRFLVAPWRRTFLLSVFALTVCVLAGTSRADIVLYQVPGSNLVFVLQGSVTANPGRTVTFRHAQFGNLYFSLDNVQTFEAPSTRALASRKLQKAVSSGDADACLEAGRWALHNGLLADFYKAASAAWNINKQHPTVLRLADLRRKMQQPIAESTSAEQELRDFVKNSRDMKILRSPHFVLLHDTSDVKGRNKKTRAEERLELLETVYESFLMKFCLEGVELEVPQERLKVVLFSHKQDYMQFVNLLSPALSKASGFYHRKTNVAVFYDQGTDEMFDVLNQLNDVLQSQKEQAIRGRLVGARELVRFADTIQLLTEVARENLDIEVVSHEATHQMAGNTGLMPGDAPVPVWAAEGLATYFESPKQAAWSGIGAVNEERLQWYRGLEPDKDHSNIDFIVSDKIFSYARSTGAELHGYGQSWALTHFLMERHFSKLIQWYQAIAAKKGTDRLSDEELLATFNEIFGEDKAALDLEWRAYMRSLKTDLQLVLEDKD